jgi:tripartite-type tricarboxylate transporter receptor subunit TctC
MSGLIRKIAVILIISLIWVTAGFGMAAPKSDYPKSAIHIVVPQAAGGSTDMVARTVQPFLVKYIGGSVVIDNVTGGGGKIGISQVYRAKPDGYRLLLGVFPAWILTQKLDKSADYDILKMIPLYNISGNDYNSVAVPYDSPITNIKQFVETSAKKSLKVAGSGLGTNSYLSYVLLKDKVGAKIDYVPYNSGSDAALAVVGGHVDACVGSIISFKPLSDQNKLRVIATLGPERADLYPDVPTLVESGYKEASFNIILGLMAPPGLPKAITTKLETALDKAVNDPAFREAAQKANIGVVPMKAAAFKRAIMDSDKVVTANLEALKAGSGQ